MAVFREYNSGGKDRSAEDRRRHRQLVEKAIKKNLHEIVAEESIIGQSKDKKIKIPIRGLREYQFIYGRNQGGVGTGTGRENGAILSPGSHQPRTGKAAPGRKRARRSTKRRSPLRTWSTISLRTSTSPPGEKETLRRETVVSQKPWVTGQRHSAPPGQKRSVAERSNAGRAVAGGSAVYQGRRFPFHEEDLRYRHIREEKRRQTNAVVFCIMDTSGSMDQTKKYLARSFYFLLYQYLRLKYTEVEVVFIAHTTTAREVREEEFFHRVEAGGTFISSGYRKALEIIEERFNPAVWNIYAFHTSDGDNWSEDNEQALAAARELCQVCNLFGYGEIDPDGFHVTSPISRLFQDALAEKNFAIVKINGKEDLFPAMKKLLTLEE